MAFHDNYVIDPEFQSKLPVNDAGTIERLESQLKKEGCLDPVRVWATCKGVTLKEQIIVDGMTRVPICRRLKIKFKVVEMEFADREEAMRWIVINQLSRRDLTDTYYAYALGTIYNSKVEENAQKHRSEQTNVAAEMSEETGKSTPTLYRFGEMAEVLDAIGEINPKLKSAVLDESVDVPLEELKEVIEQPTRRGKKKKAKAILAGPIETVSLGGDDEPPKVYDGLGNVVENVAYHEVFVEIETFNEIIRELRGCEAKMKRLANTVGGAALHVEELTLTRVKSELDCRIPWCICSTCKGSKTIMVNDKRIECPDCASMGFMTKFNYERKINKGKKK